MGYCSVCGKEIESAAGMCEECKSKSNQSEGYMDALLQGMDSIEDESLRAFKEKIAMKAAKLNAEQEERERKKKEEQQLEKEAEAKAEADQDTDEQSIMEPEVIVPDTADSGIEPEGFDPAALEQLGIDTTVVEEDDIPIDELPDINIDDIPELDIEDLNDLGIEELSGLDDLNSEEENIPVEDAGVMTDDDVLSDGIGDEQPDIDMDSMSDGIGEELPDIDVDSMSDGIVEELPDVDMDSVTNGIGEELPDMDVDSMSDGIGGELPDIDVDSMSDDIEGELSDLNMDSMSDGIGEELPDIDMDSMSDGIGDGLPDIDLDSISDSSVDDFADINVEGSNDAGIDVSDAESLPDIEIPDLSDMIDMDAESLPDIEIPDISELQDMDDLPDISGAETDRADIDNNEAGTDLLENINMDSTSDDMVTEDMITNDMVSDIPDNNMEDSFDMGADNDQNIEPVSEAGVQPQEESVDDVLDEMMAMDTSGDDALEALFENSASMGNENGELDDVNMEEFDLDSLLEATDNIEMPSVEDMMNAAGQEEIDALLASDQESNNSSSDSDDIDLENIDLNDLLMGDDDGLELVEDDTDGGDGNKDAGGNSTKASASSGENVLIDNDLLAVEGDSQNVGDVLSDALSVLSSDQGGEDSSDVSELLENTKGKGKKKKKEKKDKPGLFSKLFGNIVDEKEIQKVKDEKAAEEAAKKQKEEDAEKKKEEAEAAKQAKEEAKAAKAKEKEEKKQIKAAEKQAKKEEKALKALEEENEIEGRINKAGAAIVFFVLGLMAVFIFFGTKMFSYSNSIKNAQAYFENGKYAESYRELLGVDIKESDEILYQKVITVMYVYKQIEAYDVYYKESKYPEALDSLLKGMREYQKYMPDAVELDITADLETVKKQIVNEMETEFGITEDMAKEINGITDSVEYSRRVYDLAQNLASVGL